MENETNPFARIVGVLFSGFAVKLYVIVGALYGAHEAYSFVAKVFATANAAMGMR